MRPNNRRKWNDRNAALEEMEKQPVYVGDKTTRPYLEHFGEVKEQADKIIFCLRDPRDIFRSKYWDLIDGDPVQSYVSHMQNVLEHDITNVLFIRYEWAVLNVEVLAGHISKYLELETQLDITGHNYKPVRRLAWNKKPEVELPQAVYNIMEVIGYETHL